MSKIECKAPEDALLSQEKKEREGCSAETQEACCQLNEKVKSTFLEQELGEEGLSDSEELDTFLSTLADNPDLVSDIKNNQEYLENFLKIPASKFLERDPEELRSFFVDEAGQVDFYESNQLYQAIGAGDLYGPDQEFIAINGVIGKRSVSPNGKVGYLDGSGQYLKIDTGYTVEVHTGEGFEFVKPESEWIFLTPEQEIEAQDAFKAEIETQEDLYTHLESLSGINTINESAVKGWIGKYFPSGVNLDQALAIVKGESDFNASELNGIHNNPGGGNDVGLWQINTKYQEGLLQNMKINPEDLYDGETNVRVAAEVYRRAGNSWSPWIAARELGYA